MCVCVHSYLIFVEREPLMFCLFSSTLRAVSWERSRLLHSHTCSDPDPLHLKTATAFSWIMVSLKILCFSSKALLHDTAHWNELFWLISLWIQCFCIMMLHQRFSTLFWPQVHHWPVFEGLSPTFSKHILIYGNPSKISY